MTVPDVWARVMDFDAGEYKAVGPEGAPAIEGWLLENRDAWLNEMRRPSIDSSVAERVFIVVGEAGSGKTTLMDLIACDETMRNGFPLYFDFKNAPTLDGHVPKQQIAVAISEFMRHVIELSVDDAGYKHEYVAAKARYLVRNRSTQRFEELLDQHPDLKSYTDSQILGCKEVIEEARRYESAHPEEFIATTAAQFLPSRSRTVILIDNVEGLEPGVRDVLFRKMTAVQQGRSLLFVAIRSENQRQADSLLQGRRDEPLLLSGEKESLMRIARVRNEGARRFCLEHLPDVDDQEVQRYYRGFEASLQVVEGDEYLLGLFTGWLNDNVRSFLTLLAEMCLALPGLQGRSTRGFISARLLQRRAHTSLQKMFDPKTVPSTMYKDLHFVFLPFRILVYLENRDGVVALDDLLSDFRLSFGIADSEIRRVLDRFEDVENGKPSVLRLDKSRDGILSVHLLSCGEVFVRQVVYQCDYLQTLFDRVENPPTVASNLPASEAKLRRAIAVVENLILPSFVAEHPYINPQTRATRRMHTRLAAYESMFSYRHGHWFVGLLKVRLEAYAKERQLSKVAESTVDRLGAVEDRLNFISRGGR